MTQLCVPPLSFHRRNIDLRHLSSISSTPQSAGLSLLYNADITPHLIRLLPPKDLKSFTHSSAAASRAFNHLSDRDVDRYCEKWMRPFPRIASFHGHFLSVGCTCTLLLASSHDMSAERFSSSRFSAEFWTRGESEERRAIERAVRLGVWCVDRRGYTAREFFSSCFREEWKRRRWSWRNMCQWLDFVPVRKGRSRTRSGAAINSDGSRPEGQHELAPNDDERMAQERMAITFSLIALI